MKNKRFLRCNYAVAGVIEALLLVALVAVVLSTIQLVYIPEIMEERESDHMDEVLNQFSHIKSVIDTQSLMGVLRSDGSLAYAPMSSPLTLGSGEIPYFITERASGSLYIIGEREADDCRINIQPAPVDFPSGIPLTSIKYVASNFYFVDQTYILEGGGIILNQPPGATDPGGEVMKSPPPITVVNYTNNITIYYSLPLFKSYAGKNSTADYTTKFILTNYSKCYTHSGAVNFIHIYTEHPVAWNQSLRQDSTGILWEYYNSGYININLNTAQSPQRIEITPGSKTIYLHLTVLEIGAQIGPGWVLTNQ